MLFSIISFHSFFHLVGWNHVTQYEYNNRGNAQTFEFKKAHTTHRIRLENIKSVFAQARSHHNSERFGIKFIVSERHGNRRHTD